ncbi:hypothetical protein FB451DRAFT_570993 [Mycena latifolia]|nr:hypothetical protein FB451DRAFT_570993 [Mycena latifolia]
MESPIPTEAMPHSQVNCGHPNRERELLWNGTDCGPCEYTLPRSCKSQRKVDDSAVRRTPSPVFPYSRLSFPMAFTLLIVLFTLSASVRAAPAAGAVCLNGTPVGNAACCPFIPLAKDLQANLFDNQCGEDAREVIRLTFRPSLSLKLPAHLIGHLTRWSCCLGQLSVPLPPYDRPSLRAPRLCVAAS